MNCRYLTFEDRHNIERLYSQGEGLADIAHSLGVHISTIYREMSRGNTGELDKNGREGYSSELAQKTFQESLKRRGHRKNIAAQ